MLINITNILLNCLLSEAVRSHIIQWAQEKNRRLSDGYDFEVCMSFPHLETKLAISTSLAVRDLQGLLVFNQSNCTIQFATYYKCDSFKRLNTRVPKEHEKQTLSVLQAAAVQEASWNRQVNILF